MRRKKYENVITEDDIKIDLKTFKAEADKELSSPMLKTKIDEFRKCKSFDI